MDRIIRGIVAKMQRKAGRPPFGGEARYKTVEGEELTMRQNGGRLEIIDTKGGKSFVTIPGVNQKNGVIHVVDKVLLPKS